MFKYFDKDNVTCVTCCLIMFICRVTGMGAIDTTR